MKAAVGQEIDVNTPELDAMRRSLVQMLFIEGNHFCPGCEKSGACQLQALGYEYEMLSPHFVGLYPHREVDASHPDVLIDFNRCILCELCVRASRDVDHKEVFAIAGRGLKAELIINSPTGKLGDSAFAVTDRAAHVCPVGAILIKRVGFATAIGDRAYDREPISAEAEIVRASGASMSNQSPNKVRVRLATTSLAGCFGCHMSFLDIDERLFELAEIAEFDRSPLTDIKHCGRCDIALIEGGVCNADNVHVVRELRANAKILVAVGACAINGGLPALRNRFAVDDLLARVYRDPITDEPCVPNSPELPLALDKVYPLNAIVRVDYSLSGCPPSGDAIWKFLTDLILGRMPASRPKPPALRLGIPQCSTLKPRNRRTSCAGSRLSRSRASRDTARSPSCSTRRTGSIRCGSTLWSFAASRFSSKAGRTGKCRSPCNGSAASAR